MVKPCTGKGAAEVPVRILNLSPDGVTIYKGTRLVHHWKRITLYSFLSPHCCKDVSADKRQLLWQTVESTASDLTDGQQRQLFEVLLEFADMFAADSTDLGHTVQLEHRYWRCYTH